MITQNKLKSKLHYSPYLGTFIWVEARKVGSKIGDVAGSKDTHGHIQIKIGGKLYLAHRLAWLYMTGSFPKDEIDHVNGIRDDNRLVNLREATKNENQYNSRIRKDNTSGKKGVSVKGNKYMASARINKEKIYLGLYDTLEDASRAYQKFAKEHHGEFYYNEVET